MRKWKRVETAEGPRFRSSLASHEADLLKNLVNALIDLLDERESSSPPDELEEITGIKTGNSEPPGDPTLRRLLPDFFRPGDEDTTGSGTETPAGLNAALRNLHEPEIIDAKRVAAQQLLDTVPESGGRFALTEDQANAWVSAVNDIRLALGVMLEIGPDGPERLPTDHPMATHFDVYQWLTVLQEYLVVVLMGPRSS
ncbi:oxidative stress transcriptional regulator AosR [Mycobacterium sp. Dal123C01]|uniref:oxidative stress transcriptional regulator AosR n=1 Tax=Mycobacterium sp. Dal123C01 TaxID=3457577 RepID=UPI00403E56D9